MLNLGDHVLVGKVVLLASYPKSGNTWIRAFLTSIWSGGDNVNINRLKLQNISSRHFLDPLLGIPSGELTRDEIARLRADICDFAVRTSSRNERMFLKIHDAYLPASKEMPEPIYQRTIDRVLYIVRDPRDIAPSLARHLGRSVDTAIANMADPDYVLCDYPGRVGHYVDQFLSTWSAHVESWLDHVSAPTHVVRFEDALADPLGTFRSILNFLQIDAETTTLVKALDATRLCELQRQEQCEGFVEKPRVCRRFFYSGIAGGWHAELTRHQADTIVSHHECVMRRLAYLR